MVEVLTERYGDWAVVTGASSGIGEAYARRLTAAGLNLVIVARRVDRLRSLREELELAHGRHVNVVEADLSLPDGAESIARATVDLDVGIVISNAGYSDPGAFLAASAESRHRSAHLNVLTAVDLAHTFGTRFVERGRGAMIFTGSTSAFSPVPLLASYAASKSFLGSFAESLHDEWKGSGVDVLVSHPGPTKTELVESEGVNFDGMPVIWMDPFQVVDASLKALGRRSEIIPGIPNRMQRLMFTRLMPRRTARFIWGSLMKKVVADELTANS